MTINTRFAPSPTGYLHLGSIRTAVLNWAYAKKHNGKFYLRIEDTDKKRSFTKYIDSIKRCLDWIGINWDSEVIYQSNNIITHNKIVESLIIQKKAYRCYETEQSIQIFKKNNPHKKFVSKWREIHRINNNLKSVIRLKTENIGVTTINDKVLGKIHIDNKEIDDMVLVRSDNTPTYNLACIVDDYNMKITHIIRGSDHITNTFRQLQILKALNWEPPNYAHIPLMCSENGSKMSKREGINANVEQYQELGYLPESILKYILQIGSRHANKKIINTKQAIDSFDFRDISKSTFRFSLDKLKFINHYCIQLLSNEVIFQKVINKMNIQSITNEELKRIKKSIPLIKPRGHTINDLVQMAWIFIKYADNIDQRSKEILELYKSTNILKKILEELKNISSWEVSNIKEKSINIGISLHIKESVVMQLLRAAVLGTFQSPPIYETLYVMSYGEVLQRIEYTIKKY